MDFRSSVSCRFLRKGVNLRVSGYYSSNISEVITGSIKSASRLDIKGHNDTSHEFVLCMLSLIRMIVPYVLRVWVRDNVCVCVLCCIAHVCVYASLRCFLGVHII
jgi:hypothetical protein